MASQKDDAWQQLYDAIPRGWVVGRPPVDENTRKWRLYGYQRRAKASPVDAVLAEADSEEDALREMARKLRKARSRSRT